MSVFRNVCWTLNNFTAEEVEDIKAWGGVDYTIFGEEVGDNGTPHLQGYTEFTKQMRLSALKKLNNRIHWEKRQGTQKQAADYCKKDGKITEIGSLKKQGKRTDLEEIADLAINKEIPMVEVANTYPATYIKYSKGIEKIRCLQYTARTEKPKVYWRWGLAGTGKTRYCVENHPNHYIKDGSQWWDGYEQQEAIIIDDFCGKWPFREFLRLLDRYAYQGQTKGGYIQINSPYIYITCEFEPSAFWSGNELAQVMRRLESVTEVTKPVTEVEKCSPCPSHGEQNALLIDCKLVTEVGGNTMPPLPPCRGLTSTQSLAALSRHAKSRADVSTDASVCCVTQGKDLSIVCNVNSESIQARKKIIDNIINMINDNDYRVSLQANQNLAYTSNE